jgi:hypothetical protein
MQQRLPHGSRRCRRRRAPNSCSIALHPVAAQHHTHSPTLHLPLPPHSQAVLMLVNAVYFKGQWANQFDK